MSAKGCEEVTLPPSARHYLGQKHGLHLGVSSVDRVASLLLAKLGDFILPSIEADQEEYGDNEGKDDGPDEFRSQSDGSVCVYLHKRVDQPAHEIVQKVLR